MISTSRISISIRSIRSTSSMLLFNDFNNVRNCIRESNIMMMQMSASGAWSPNKRRLTSKLNWFCKIKMFDKIVQEKNIVPTSNLEISCVHYNSYQDEAVHHRQLTIPSNRDETCHHANPRVLLEIGQLLLINISKQVK